MQILGEAKFVYFIGPSGFPNGKILRKASETSQVQDSRFPDGTKRHGFGRYESRYTALLPTQLTFTSILSPLTRYGRPRHFVLHSDPYKMLSVKTSLLTTGCPTCLLPPGTTWSESISKSSLLLWKSLAVSALYPN